MAAERRLHNLQHVGNTSAASIPSCWRRPVPRVASPAGRRPPSRTGVASVSCVQDQGSRPPLVDSPAWMSRPKLSQGQCVPG
ncbi:hypothetical protein [Streptomyces sp. 8P21H-1]|uniref:hypothetical protein n=1 Tax=Streptomyces sp. 8P21H-1 TaxID=2737048 RepID=UPI0034A02AC2